ncbi:MAG: YlxR family protein [Lactobacillus iners]|nr:YlxR family protein [Lactobacillus iners]
MKKRKIPMRKDLITNTMMPKKELVRIVVDKEKNIFVDPTGKKAGRGAYVGIKISDEFYDELYAYVEHQRARKELFGDK